MLDLEDHPLDGYALDDCTPVCGDGTSLPVRWKAYPDLADASGQTVRLRFRLSNARLYSCRGGP